MTKVKIGIDELDFIISAVEVTRRGCWRWVGDPVARGAYFGLPRPTTCGNDWCARPKHQKNDRNAPRKARPTVEQLLREVIPEWGTNGCWSTSRPNIWNGRRLVDVARAAYEHVNGRALTPHARLYHTCETAGCVNPKHLRSKKDLAKEEREAREEREKPHVDPKTGKRSRRRY